MVAVCDGAGRTTVDGVAVVGDGGGIGGGRVAVAQGVLAGVDAARSLGAVNAIPLSLEERRARKTVRRQARFQRALWALYDAPLLTDQFASDDTHICRCEESDSRSHTRGDGRRGPVAGRAQAGYACRYGALSGPLLRRYHGRDALRARNRGDPDEMDFFAPQAPFKPVPIGAVAPGRFTESEMARRGKETQGPSGS